MRHLVGLLVFVALLSGVARAEDLLAKANQLHAEGSAAYEKATLDDDSAAQKEAIGKLRAALEIYNEHLDANPDDINRCEEQLTDINGTLFWHGRMSVPDFGDDEEEGDAGGKESSEVDAEAKQREIEVRRQKLAMDRLRTAHTYMEHNPSDLYGQRVEYREVVIQFPGTDAANEAKVQVARLDGEIIALEAEIAEAAGRRALERANEAAEADEISAESVEKAQPVRTLLEDLESRLEEMKGTEVEREIRAKIKHLFSKRRFVEAYIVCQREMDKAQAGDERARLDRILAGLSRAVTILDQVVSRTMSRTGEQISMEVTGGSVFEGKLLRLTWNAMVIQTKEAKLHLPFFRLSDDALVRQAGLNPVPEAALAAGAYLVMIGRGKDALKHIQNAEKRGADAAEVDALRILAGDEKQKSEVASKIKKETRRWRSVDRMAGKFIKDFNKQEYLDALKALLKVNKKPGLEDRDLKVLSQRFEVELGRTLATALREARENCGVAHIDESRVVSCQKCGGQGTILTRSPSGLFGPKTRGAVRVRCPACEGKKTRGCHSCFDRFHDKAARALQARVGL